MGTHPAAASARTRPTPSAPAAWSPRGGAPRSSAPAHRAGAPLVHHVRADGSAVLLLADDEPLLDRVRGGRRRARRDAGARRPGAGRPPRTRPRAALDHRLAAGARAADGAPDRAAGRRRPPAPERLLDLGHGATLVRLTRVRPCSPTPRAAPRSRPSTSRRPGRTRSAGCEDHWLAHLEEAHPEVFVALARHLPPALSHCRARGSARSASTAAACACASRHRSATTTCGWRGRAARRRPRSCASS